MPIRRLPPETVNRIAAGEVVERPASALKELVENALDAGALRVDIQADQGGLSRILVADDGAGISAEELPLAVERHATSKLAPGADGGYDLLNIFTLGFRGEALPSIGSVARLTISARVKGGEACQILVDGGAVGEVGPAPFAEPHGARVEVRDLFYATPARLKFMKSERAEALAITEEVKRQAMAHEATSFSLELDGRKVLRLAAERAGVEGRLARLGAVLGREFEDNALLIDLEREGVRLTGYAGLPTYSRGNAQHQYLFVNGRPVRDRLIGGALRAAYADFLARDRHPVAALYVELPPEEVDVNVHPVSLVLINWLTRSGAGGCECSPGQGGGALPRPRSGARPDHRGAAPRSGGRRPSGLDHGGGSGSGQFPASGRGLSTAAGFRTCTALERRGPVAQSSRRLWRPSIGDRAWARSPRPQRTQRTCRA